MNRVKRFEQFLNEENGGFYKEFLTQYKFIASVSSGMQKEYYESVVKDAKDVKISSIYDVFTEEEIERIKSRVHPKKKQCYANSYHLCTAGLLGYNILYCEGFTEVCGIPIEHAFNKVNDLYVDITLELAVGDDVKKNDYVLIGEYQPDKALELMAERGVYGGCYQENFIRTHKENVTQHA